MSTKSPTPTNAPQSTTHPPRLGTCPECDTTLASLDVSIVVEDDRPVLYTECSVCCERVNPD